MRFKFWGAELHTVHDGRIDDLHLAMKAVLSQELISEIRRRTRDGMRQAVKEGKAAGGLSYGYQPRLIYDEKGERIPGHREIVAEQADIIVRIFTDNANGKSPQQIASELNADGVPGPRGAHWRDAAIRGSRERGTGVLNNELYVGRIVWNRREFVKDPDMERRVAQSNAREDWVLREVPELRIVEDQLWSRVKTQQLKPTRHSTAQQPMRSTAIIGRPIFSAVYSSVMSAAGASRCRERTGAIVAQTDLKSCRSSIWMANAAQTTRASAAPNLRHAWWLLFRQACFQSSVSSRSKRTSREPLA